MLLSLYATYLSHLVLRFENILSNQIWVLCQSWLFQCSISVIRQYVCLQLLWYSILKKANRIGLLVVSWKKHTHLEPSKDMQAQTHAFAHTHRRMIFTSMEQNSLTDFALIGADLLLWHIMGKYTLCSRLAPSKWFNLAWPSPFPHLLQSRLRPLASPSDCSVHRGQEEGYKPKLCREPGI